VEGSLEGCLFVFCFHSLGKWFFRSIDQSHQQTEREGDAGDNWTATSSPFDPGFKSMCVMNYAGIRLNDSDSAYRKRGQEY
jgi:hypothetical protein